MLAHGINVVAWHRRTGCIMKYVALLLACAAAALTVVGLLAVLDIFDAGALGSWAPFAGIALWFVALTLFSRAKRVERALDQDARGSARP